MISYRPRRTAVSTRASARQRALLGRCAQFCLFGYSFVFFLFGKNFYRTTTTHRAHVHDVYARPNRYGKEVLVLGIIIYCYIRQRAVLYVDTRATVRVDNDDIRKNVCSSACHVTAAAGSRRADDGTKRRRHACRRRGKGGWGVEKTCFAIKKPMTTAPTAVNSGSK